MTAPLRCADSIPVVKPALPNVFQQSHDADTAGDVLNITYRFSGREMLSATNNRGQENIDYQTSIANRRVEPANHDATRRFNVTAYNNNTWEGEQYTDAGQAYDPLNSYNQGSRSGTYTVRAGDTLQSIASSIYGDSGLWYKIASANGLSSGSALNAGSVINLPVGVVKTAHNSETFKPYDPAAAIGDVSPTTAKPGDEGCGALGQVIMTVIAVAVTVVTGSPVLGNLASQAVGIVTGIQDGFDWKGLALSVVAANVSAGVSAIAGTAQTAVGAGLQAAASSTITQGIGVATGIQDKFSWSAVAASGVGAFAGFLAADLLPGSASIKNNFKASYRNRVGSYTVNAIASAATRSAMGDGNFGDNLVSAIPDVIGQAVGNAIPGGPNGEPLWIAKKLPGSELLKQLNGATTIVGRTVGEKVAAGIRAQEGQSRTVTGRVDRTSVSSSSAYETQSYGDEDYVQLAQLSEDLPLKPSISSLSCTDGICSDDTGQPIFETRDPDFFPLLKELAEKGDFLSRAQDVAGTDGEPIIIISGSTSMSFLPGDWYDENGNVHSDVYGAGGVLNLYGLPEDLVGRASMVIGRSETAGAYSYNPDLVAGYENKFGVGKDMGLSTEAIVEHYRSSDPIPSRFWTNFLNPNHPRTDAYVGNRRVIVHELNHLFNGGGSYREQSVSVGGHTSQSLKFHGKEEVVIAQTNEFMYKYYSQAPRYEVPHSNSKKSVIVHIP